MKMMKRLLAALLLLAMCCTLAACEKDTAVTPAATDAGSEVVQPAGNPDDVMLTVGEQALTRAQYEGYLRTMTNYYGNYGYDVTDAALLAMLKYFALKTGVEYLVMDQKLAELGLSLTEDEKTAVTVEAREQWNATVADGLAYYGITETSTEEERAATMLNVLTELEGNGYTEESYLEDALSYAAHDKLYEHATQNITVTEEQIVAYYPVD